MECNRDEAARAKEIAEKKFAAKDIIGAKKFAVKAQSLYPELDGIQQMLLTLDVHITAQARTNGEADWYAILGVHPRADDNAIRKQYRKLALLLHPDKNKSIGAEGAFKHISEAWSVLSDKEKRSTFDRKWNSKAFKQKSPPENGFPSAPPRSTPKTSVGPANGVPSAPSSSNGNHPPAKNTTPVNHQKSKKPKTSVGSGSAPSHYNGPSTFWTICRRCNMQYEYPRMVINCNILCPKCREAFFASETPPPTCNGTKGPTQPKHPQKKPGSNGGNKSGAPNGGYSGFFSRSSSTSTIYQWNPHSKGELDEAANNFQSKDEDPEAGKKTEESAAKKTNDVKQSTETTVKTGTETTGLSGVENGSSEPNKTNGLKKRKAMDDQGTEKLSRDTIIKTGTETPGLSGVKNSISSEPNKAGGVKKPKTNHLEIQNSLVAKAQMDIRSKLIYWNSATIPESSEEGNVTNNAMVVDESKNGNARGPPNKEASLMDVPDAEFHDFDKDRTEKCFGENQVWTVYDDDDGMPRLYAMIHNVISRNPFKVRMSWLNSKTNSELGPLNWVGSGFSKTCGDFRIGKHEINKSLNSFSHKVRWTKGKQGIVRVFPGKGDVWALYRNWSPDWNELTPDEFIHKYDMVKVLEDYDDELGITVTPLVKVAGFRTLFHQHLDPKEVKRIPREEMFRFSHHVPSYMLRGQEAPKGCLELDPAATPEELLHVIKDITEDETMETEENAKLGKLVGDDAGGGSI